MNDTTSMPDRDRQARLLAKATELRPELHRYCARVMGSVIDGEDVVQDAFAKAMTAFDELQDDAQLRSWLFRIAHNRALDQLRGRAIRATEPIEAAYEAADQAAPDPVEKLMQQQAVKTAVSRFAELPILQRSAVILKDVLDEPLAEIAALLGLSIDAVKGHLARGRRRIREINARPQSPPGTQPASPAVARYVALFNQRDWQNLRVLLADDVRLHQSLHPPRTGAADVGMFFTHYARSEGVRLAPAWLEGREVIAVFEHPGETEPSHFMWLDWRDGRISFIRDYRYVRYVARDAELVLAPVPDAPRNGDGH